MWCLVNLIPDTIIITLHEHAISFVCLSVSQFVSTVENVEISTFTGLNSCCIL